MTPGSTVWRGIRAVWAAALAAALFTFAFACSSTPAPAAAVDAGGETVACPVASGCPATVPSYAKVIQPILAEACIPCHSPSGTAGFDETSYEDVANQASPMLDQVNGCQMPPVNGPQLSAAQRVALTGWLECGAPNN